LERFKDEETGKIVRRETFIERALSKASVRIILAALCSVLNHALEDWLIVSNPATRLGKFYKQTKALHAEIQPLIDKEVPVFLRDARVHCSEYFPLPLRDPYRNAIG